MKPLSFFIIVNLSFFIILFTPSVSLAGEDGVVVLENESYNPKELTILSGTTVTWVNKDFDLHSVTADDGTFDSSTVQPEGTFSHTFKKPGVYPYHCIFHQPDMVGKIVVK
jgi:plastocyanin